MSISSPFLDALTPSAIRSITAQIREKAAQGVKSILLLGDCLRQSRSQ